MGWDMKIRHSLRFRRPGSSRCELARYENGMSSLLPKCTDFEQLALGRLGHPFTHVTSWENPGNEVVTLTFTRELKIETFSGRRQLQPDVTSSFVGYCACSCSPPCRRSPVGDVKLVCLALWRKREYLTFISIRFVAFSNQHFADYRS